MVIDFHTHIFPDRIAARTIDLLSKKINGPAFSDGTLSGLGKELRKGEVDIGIALPVLTRPESFDSVLRFTMEVNEGYFRGEHNVCSFAAIHPDCKDVEEKMFLIKQHGFKGIKIHPEYQQTYIDDPKYIRILNAAIDQGLIVVTHSGFDDAYPNTRHCTPRRVVNALEKIKGNIKLVLAHYGAYDMYEEVYEYIAGRDVYLDTAYVLPDLEKDTILKILQKHGEDKILFASDSPWRSIESMKQCLLALGLSKECEEKILFKNALNLLQNSVLR